MWETLGVRWLLADVQSDETKAAAPHICLNEEYRDKKIMWRNTVQIFIPAVGTLLEVLSSTTPKPASVFFQQPYYHI